MNEWTNKSINTFGSIIKSLLRSTFSPKLTSVSCNPIVCVTQPSFPDFRQFDLAVKSSDSEPAGISALHLPAWGPWAWEDPMGISFIGLQHGDNTCTYRTICQRIKHVIRVRHLTQWLAHNKCSLNVSYHYFCPLKPWLFFSILLVPMEARCCPYWPPL